MKVSTQIRLIGLTLLVMRPVFAAHIERDCDVTYDREHVKRHVVIDTIARTVTDEGRVWQNEAASSKPTAQFVDVSEGQITWGGWTRDRYVWVHSLALDQNRYAVLDNTGSVVAGGTCRATTRSE